MTRDRILAESPRCLWMTTAVVAKRLDVTRQWVNALARQGDLPFERTESGQRMYRRSDVRRVAQAREDARARTRPMQLRIVRRRMLKTPLKPRQMDLFRPRLQVVRGERSDPHAEVKRTKSFDVPHGSEKPGYVTRKAAGSRR
jgi:DNA-binding transcriptional MerR regulator